MSFLSREGLILGLCCPSKEYIDGRSENQECKKQGKVKAVKDI